MNEQATRLNLDQLRIQAKELLKAVRAGDPDAVSIARNYFSPEEEFRLAGAQLVIARENDYGSWPEMRAALAGGAPDLTTQLFEAIDSLDEGRVLRLLTRAPNLAGSWRKTHYGGWQSGLHVAAKLGSLEIATALVEAGAEVYAVNQSDYPPVFEAHYSGNKALVAYLLEASASRDHGQPPTYGCGIDLVCAARIGMLDRVQMHIAKDPYAVYRRGCIGESVLHWPAHNGHVAVVESLIDAGAIIEADEIGLYGGKPTHWAAEHAPATLRVLLDHGANPRSRNLLPGEFEGYTPLHMCARQREECIENAEMLLSAGAELGALDTKGQSAADVANANGRAKMEGFLRTA